MSSQRDSTVYPKMIWTEPCQVSAFISFQNTEDHCWFEWERSLCSASGFGRNVREGELPGPLNGGGWISRTWLRRLCANIPFGTTIPVITECEDLIIFKSDEWVQLFCRPVWSMWEHGITAQACLSHSITAVNFISWEFSESTSLDRIMA